MLISAPALHGIPAIRFLHEAMTMRLLLLIAFFLTMLSGMLFFTREETVAMFGCTGDDSVLVYPIYGSKAVVVDQKMVCGKPHRTCVLRSSAEVPTYDCSPFMAPKGTFTR